MTKEIEMVKVKVLESRQVADDIYTSATWLRSRRNEQCATWAISSR